MGVEGFVLLVKADDVVGTGENHPFHAMATGRFVDMEHAADIGAENLFERTLHRHAAEVQDRIHAFDQLMHRLLVGEVARHDFFAIINGWRHVGDVRQTEYVGVRSQAFAQDFTEATGGAGQSRRLNGDVVVM